MVRRGDGSRSLWGPFLLSLHHRWRRWAHGHSRQLSSHWSFSPARPNGGAPGSEVAHRTTAPARMEALDEGQGGGHTVDPTVDAGAWLGTTYTSVQIHVPALGAWGHFTDEEREAQSGSATCPRSQSKACPQHSHPLNIKDNGQPTAPPKA